MCIYIRDVYKFDKCILHNPHAQFSRKTRDAFEILGQAILKRTCIGRHEKKHNLWGEGDKGRDFCKKIVIFRGTCNSYI